MEFRAATPADTPLLRQLAKRIWRTSYTEMISGAQIEYMLTLMYSAAKIAAEMAAGVHWEIALLDGSAAGYFSLTFHSATLAELNKLYLLTELQGRGFGQQMLTRAIECATAHRCAELRLRVNKSNARALRSYMRAGFEIVDSLVADIGGGFVMDDYVLSRNLSGSNTIHPRAMDEIAITQYITETFAGIELANAGGATFFFCGSDRKFPFATIVTSDNVFDRSSNLDRESVFRLNIGVSRQTFRSIFGTPGSDAEGPHDFTALDRLMPHPVYGSMNWVCVLNPSEGTFRTIKPLLAEAYDRAVKKHTQPQTPEVS